MSFNPSNNTVSVEVTKDLEQKINNATSTGEIYQALKDAYEQQNLTERDYFNPDIVYPTEKAYTERPKVMTRRFVVDGKEIILEGASEAELTAKELEMHRQIQQQREEPAAQQQTHRDAATGQFISGEEAATDAAVAAYLSRQGIDINALRAKSDEEYVANWSAASEDFRSRHGEWAGGQQNMQRLGEIVFELGLQDSPSADSLDRAYAEMQRRNLYQRDTEEAQAARAEQEIGRATSVEDIRALSRRAIGLPPVNSNFRS